MTGKRIWAAVCVCVLVQAGLFAADPVPSYLRRRVEWSLKQAGPNAAELERFLKEVKPNLKKAAFFLVAYMPERDLKSLRADFLSENLRLAYKAWRKAPWADDVPEEIFLEYVLPYFSFSEKRTRWRKRFYREFHREAFAAGEIEKAVLFLNRFVQKNVPYDKAYKRPHIMDPLQSIREGSARCTSQSILLVALCRSCGIPARCAATPFWRTRKGEEGNHTWVEVWDGVRWRFTGAGEPDAFDKTWFVEEAKTAGVIYAISFSPKPHRYWGSYAQVVTPRYKLLREVTFTLPRPGPKKTLAIRRITGEICAVAKPRSGVVRTFLTGGRTYWFHTSGKAFCLEAPADPGRKAQVRSSPLLFIVKSENLKRSPAGKAFLRECRRWGNLLDIGRGGEGLAFCRKLREKIAGTVKKLELEDAHIVLAGGEGEVPGWPVKAGDLSFAADALYGDLDADGIPEFPVTRLLGGPAARLRQLQLRLVEPEGAVIFCSEDTRIHWESQLYAAAFLRLGLRTKRIDVGGREAVSRASCVLHLGHGDSKSLSNRWHKPFVTAKDIPPLPYEPVFFIGGCSVGVPNSPLVHGLLEAGAGFVMASSATVPGMIPDRDANRMHTGVASLLAARAHLSLSRILCLARRKYIESKKGLAAAIRAGAEKGSFDPKRKEQILIALEYRAFGAPLLRFRAEKRALPVPKSLYRVAAVVPQGVKLGAEVCTLSFARRGRGGLAVVELHWECPADLKGRLEVRVNGKRVWEIPAVGEIPYFRLKDHCVGGHREGNLYKGLALLPLFGAREPGGSYKVTVSGPAGVELLAGSRIVVWPKESPLFWEELKPARAERGQAVR